MSDNEMTTEQWLAIRKEAAAKINAETAEVICEYGSIRDPYYLFEHGDDWEDNIGRNYFARSFGSDVWVSFHDLPAGVRDRLRTRMKAGDFDDARDEVPF
jgi:hypothetical protein